MLSIQYFALIDLQFQYFRVDIFALLIFCGFDISLFGVLRWGFCVSTIFHGRAWQSPHGYLLLHITKPSWLSTKASFVSWISVLVPASSRHCHSWWQWAFSPRNSRLVLRRNTTSQAKQNPDLVPNRSARLQNFVFLVCLATQDRRKPPQGRSSLYSAFNLSQWSMLYVLFICCVAYVDPGALCVVLLGTTAEVGTSGTFKQAWRSVRLLVRPAADR